MPSTAECPINVVEFCSGHVPEIRINTARLTVNNRKGTNVTLYLQSENCEKCPLVPRISIAAGSNCSVLVDTRWPVRVEISPRGNRTTPLSCREGNLTTTFMEGGMYHVHVQSNGNPMICSSMILLNSPTDCNIPIYVSMGIAVICAFLWIGFKIMYRNRVFLKIMICFGAERLMQTNMSTTQDLGVPASMIAPDENSTNTPKEKKPAKERLKSLDCFRGISIVVMIFVNYGGGQYWFFKHSKWNGLTVADLVFPWFVFIMGTAMAYSFRGLLRRSVAKRDILLKIFKRAVILFGLGLIINSLRTTVHLERLRIPGVLQRFAGTYLIVGTIHLLFCKSSDNNQFTWWSPLRDVLSYWKEWVLYFILLAIYLTLTFVLQVPNCPTGYLGPGGYHDNCSYYNCTGGAAGYIDGQIFSDSHIYQHPTSKEIYLSEVPYDPEGLLGTITSCFICFLGLQAGKILLIHTDWVKRIKRFMFWALFLGIIAIILCKGTKNDGFIPINKNLWSLSFVLAVAALSYVLLGFCYLMIDVFQIWSGAPFYYPGMNAIVLYMGHELLNGTFPVAWSVPNTHAARLAMNLWGTTVWCFVALYLHHKNTFINV